MDLRSMDIHGSFLFMDIVRSVLVLSYLPNLVGWGHQIRKLPDWGTKSIKILNCKLGLDPMCRLGATSARTRVELTLATLRGPS